MIIWHETAMQRETMLIFWMDDLFCFQWRESNHGVFMWEGERCRRESWQPVSCRSTNRCTSKIDRWFNRRYVVYIMHVYMDTIMEDIMPVFYDRFVPSRYVVAGCFKCVTKRCAISITGIILISMEKFQLSMSSYVGNIKLCFRKLCNT